MIHTSLELRGMDIVCSSAIPFLAGGALQRAQWVQNGARSLTPVQLDVEQHGTDGVLGSLSKGDVCFSGEVRLFQQFQRQKRFSFSTTWSSHDCAQCLKIAANLHSSCTVRVRSMGGKFKSAVESIASNCRGVAQPGSAPALGAGGPRFKSGRPDH